MDLNVVIIENHLRHESRGRLCRPTRHMRLRGTLGGIDAVRTLAELFEVDGASIDELASVRPGWLHVFDATELRVQPDAAMAMACLLALVITSVDPDGFVLIGIDAVVGGWLKCHLECLENAPEFLWL